MSRTGEPAGRAPVAEATWAEWLAGHEIGQLDLDNLARRGVLVLAPHPDDETLGAGGLLSELGSRGARVRVLAITDGEGSHPLSPSVDHKGMAARRRREGAEALWELGIGEDQVARLGLPDGAVWNHYERLLGRLLELADGEQVLLAPFRTDGHPDHEATCAAALAVAEEKGCAVLQYPIWMWHWIRPARLPEIVPRLRQLRLSPAQMAAKRRAIARFQSQTEPLSPDPRDSPVLSAQMLAHFRRELELFVA